MEPAVRNCLSKRPDSVSVPHLDTDETENSVTPAAVAPPRPSTLGTAHQAASGGEPFSGEALQTAALLFTSGSGSLGGDGTWTRLLYYSHSSAIAEKHPEHLDSITEPPSTHQESVSMALRLFLHLCTLAMTLLHQQVAQTSTAQHPPSTFQPKISFWLL